MSCSAQNKLLESLFCVAFFCTVSLLDIFCFDYFQKNLEELAKLRERQAKTLEKCRALRKNMSEFEVDFKAQVNYSYFCQFWT